MSNDEKKMWRIKWATSPLWHLKPIAGLHEDPIEWRGQARVKLKFLSNGSEDVYFDDSAVGEDEEFDHGGQPVPQQHTKVAVKVTLVRITGLHCTSLNVNILAKSGKNDWFKTFSRRELRRTFRWH